MDLRLKLGALLGGFDWHISCLDRIVEHSAKINARRKQRLVLFNNQTRQLAVSTASDQSDYAFSEESVHTEPNSRAISGKKGVSASVFVSLTRSRGVAGGSMAFDNVGSS